MTISRDQSDGRHTEYSTDMGVMHSRSLSHSSCCDDGFPLPTLSSAKIKRGGRTSTRSGKPLSPCTVGIAPRAAMRPEVRTWKQRQPRALAHAKTLLVNCCSVLGFDKSVVMGLYFH